jgi:transposase InsO family protein
MEQRREFVMLARAEGANVRRLCQRYGISPTTGYKWLGRGAELAEQSRRPKSSPERTPAAMEGLVLALRDRHPAWGGRKLRRRLCDQGHVGVPSPSTITEILCRHGRLEPAEAAQHTAWQRFAHSGPNELWQMDFKGHFAIDSGRCHPLTVLDDHSRFAIGLEACGDERGPTVQQRLTGLFRRFGLPRLLLADNGPPWRGEDHTSALAAWLIQLGIHLVHGRPYHPQTQGKDERFHRTLKAELVGRRRFRDLAECQQAFNAWRQVYNSERPHQALQLATPISRYQPSRRSFPERLPPIAYGDGGRINFRNREWRVGRAFVGLPVALRPTLQDGVFDVHFCHQRVARIDLHATA